MNDAIGLIIILSFIMIAGTFAILAIDAFKIHGQDVDPRYVCIEKYHTWYPFSELCNRQQINDLYNEILSKAQK